MQPSPSHGLRGLGETKEHFLILEVGDLACGLDFKLFEQKSTLSSSDILDTVVQRSIFCTVLQTNILS